jgi:hypothetical protein
MPEIFMVTWLEMALTPTQVSEVKISVSQRNVCFRNLFRKLFPVYQGLNFTSKIIYVFKIAVIRNFIVIGLILAILFIFINVTILTANARTQLRAL